jgi:hypothetical protein
MNLDVMSAVHFIAEAWILITMKNCFAKCGFLVGHVYSNDDNEVTLTEDDKRTGLVCNLLEYNLRTT